MSEMDARRVLAAVWSTEVEDGFYVSDFFDDDEWQTVEAERIIAELEAEDAEA